MSLVSIDPSSGKTLQRFEEHTDAQLEQILEVAAQRFATYRFTSLTVRAAWLQKAGALLEAEREPLARLIVEEMGKTLRSAVAEVQKCAHTCRYYAEHSARYLADEPIPTEPSKSFVRCLPLGPVLAIMPWNFPCWQVVRFAAPALMAGNVGLLKHASNVTRCALALESVFSRAGFPTGVFQTLLLSSKRIGKVLADPRIKAATLTGSEGAGIAVASAAGQSLKKVVLELGGSDPFLVMPSANLDEAVRVGVNARTLNAGQSCIAAKRFIIHEAVYSQFEEGFVAAMARLQVGDPMLEGTDLGPLATREVLESVDRQVRESVERGARLVLGGKPRGGEGHFYPATVLADIPSAAPVHQEEVFGPVALLFRVGSVDQAIALANDTPFGLGSSAWTGDLKEQERFVNELDAGQTFINAMVASDPRLPFGGVKRSGYGRELGALGPREFCNLKTISIGPSAPPGRQESE